MGGSRSAILTQSVAIQSQVLQKSELSNHRRNGWKFVLGQIQIPQVLHKTSKFSRKLTTRKVFILRKRLKDVEVVSIACRMKKNGWFHEDNSVEGYDYTGE